MAEAQHMPQRYHNEPKTVQDRVLVVGDLIERQFGTAGVVGDNAKSMAEYAVFHGYGKDLRHLGLKGMKREVRAAVFAMAQNSKDNG